MSINGSMSVVDLHRKMVCFDSVNGAHSGKAKPEEELSRYLDHFSVSQGLETRPLPVPGQADNLLVLYKRNSARPWLLFDSHLDTVTVEGMSIDPFAAVVRDGKVWGRGASDTKASGAAMLSALIRYSKEPTGATGIGEVSNSGNNVAILFSVDEEQGMTGVRAFARESYPKLGFVFKGAIVGEPTRLEPIIAHNGVLRFIVRTHGVSAHSATPEKGKSAISSMARLVSYLEDVYIPSLTRRHDLTGKAESSINVIRGGSGFNVIPELCEIHVDRRTVPGEVPAHAEKAFQAALDVFLKTNPDEKISFETHFESPPLPPAKKTGFIDDVRAVLRDLNMKDDPKGVSYATNAGDLSAVGIPSVVLGPGDIAQGHTKDEWVDIAEIEKGVEVYYKLMSS